MKIGNKTFESGTHIMAIVNLTPDSFWKMSRNDEYTVLKTVERAITDGASVIDLGAQSTRPGYTEVGAQCEISRLERPLRLIKDNFDIPVSVDTYFPECADFALGAGADMITVHGRTRDKIYAGEVDFDAVARAKNSVVIPVIANGGVFCKADAENLIKKTGADGVAVARGAMYSPWLFAEITGGEVPDKKGLILKQLEDTLALYGERFACVFMRKMAAFYIKGRRDCAEYRRRLFAAQTSEEVLALAEEIFKNRS